MQINLKTGEKIDDLQLKALKIIQNENDFKFGIDAVLLSHFTKTKRSDEIVDLGTGTGIIPILISGKKRFYRITGLELQEHMADMAMRSVKLNGLEHKIEIIKGNIKSCEEIFKGKKFDVAVTNPPYISKSSGLTGIVKNKAISRHEIECTLEDVVKAASTLLKDFGSIYMVHRPDRLVDIIYYMREYGLEPKIIRYVHPREGKAPNLVLIKGIKGANAGLITEEPLCVYKEDGSYTDEILVIYNIGNRG